MISTTLCLGKIPNSITCKNTARNRKNEPGTLQCWASNHEITQGRPTCTRWGLTMRCLFFAPSETKEHQKCCLQTIGVHCKLHFQWCLAIFSPQQGTVNIQSLIGGDAPAQRSILMTQPWHHRPFKSERALKMLHVTELGRTSVPLWVSLTKGGTPRTCLLCCFLRHAAESQLAVRFADSARTATVSIRAAEPSQTERRTSHTHPARFLKRPSKRHKSGQRQCCVFLSASVAVV